MALPASFTERAHCKACVESPRNKAESRLQRIGHGQVLTFVQVLGEFLQQFVVSSASVSN